MASINPYLTAQKRDSRLLNVAIHPLVLLTISDLITRHALRNMQTPLIGALLGQDKGEEITVVHAFECLPVDHQGGTWWSNRVSQMLKVHSSPHETPDLSLVGWFTLVPSSGPGLEQAESQFALYTHYKTPLILLGFHPSSSLGLGGSLRGKFPLTIYDATCPDPDLDTQQVGVSSEVRFSEVPYSIETGEAEMIGLAYVSKGGGNATAVETVKKSAPVDKAAVQKGKKKAGNEESQEADSARAEEQNVLSREEEELIASLTTKANAIKMLQSRIDLITKYLELLPPSYITSDSSAMESEADGNQTSVNYSILRSIKAMLHRLSLLIPSDNISFNQELLSEKNDVNLVNLLSTLTQSIESSRELGRKFAIVDHARHLWRSGAKKMGASSQSDLENDRWGREYSSSAISGVGDLMS